MILAGGRRWCMPHGGGHEAVVEALLEAGASAPVWFYGQDQTLAAVCEGHPTAGIVRRLVDAGADVESRCYGRPALCNAARLGNVAVMVALVDLGVDVAATDLMGWTAMHWAANGEVMGWLAARGLSVHGNSGEDSPLHCACRHGRLNAVRALIELGVDFNHKDGDGKTPLHHAVCFHKEPEAMEMTLVLLAAGADINAVDGRGSTPLHCVGHATCADVLVDTGADLEARDRQRQTPLYHALCLYPEQEAVELTRALLAAGADINAVDGRGSTPLHCVGHAMCADVLVEAGADLEVRDTEGKTAIYAAATSTRNRSEVVLRLADRGADLVNTGGEPGLLMRKVEELRAERSPNHAD